MLQSYTDMNMDKSYMLETMHAHTPNTACTHSTHTHTHYRYTYVKKNSAYVHANTHTNSDVDLHSSDKVILELDSH